MWSSKNVGPKIRGLRIIDTSHLNKISHLEQTEAYYYQEMTKVKNLIWNAKWPVYQILPKALDILNATY